LPLPLFIQDGIKFHLSEIFKFQDLKPEETAQKLEKNYEIRQLDSAASETAEEIENFDSFESKFLSKYTAPTKTTTTPPKPINPSSITHVVQRTDSIKDYDQTIEIVDSVLLDHVSEDDRSISSEEVLYERWTEETKLIKTKIFKDGKLVDEIIERKSPELVGDVLREKLIERHEHIKHISQDILKRVRVKSPGRSVLSMNDLRSEELLDGSSVIIVEPAKTTRKGLVNTTLLNTKDDESGTKTAVNNNNNNNNTALKLDHLTKLPNINNSKHALTKPVLSKIGTYYGGLQARNLENKIIENKCESVLVFKNNNNEQNLSVSAHYEKLNDSSSSSDPKSKQSEKIKAKYEKNVSNGSSLETQAQNLIESLKTENSSVISQSITSSNSIEQYERPTQSEMKQMYQKKSTSSIVLVGGNTSDLSEDEAILISEKTDSIKRNRPLRRESFELAQNNRKPKQKISGECSTDDSETTNKDQIRQKSSLQSVTLTKPPIIQKTQPKIKVNNSDISAGANRVKSISPRLLRRGPDIIETIETTTSMSFIMNKTIDLVIEERRENPNHNAQTKTTQQQQLQPSRLTNTYLSNSKPIPIQINHYNLRSKSAPKTTPNHRSNNVTFHRSESSNEIIAVVNVPQAYETTTVESAANFSPSSSSSLYNNKSQFSHSKSVPNLYVNSNQFVKPVKFEIDIEKREPNYAYKNHTSVEIDGVRIKPQQQETTSGRVCVENIPLGSHLVINSNYTGPENNSQNSLNDNLNNNENTTRISSGYFSGDDFKSSNYFSTFNTNTLMNYPQSNNFVMASGSPTISSSTNDSTSSAASFLLNNRNVSNVSKRVLNNYEEDPLEEVNRMYKQCIQTNIENDNEFASSRLKFSSDFSSSSFSYNNNNSQRRLKDDMAARLGRVNLSNNTNTNYAFINITTNNDSSQSSNDMSNTYLSPFEQAKKRSASLSSISSGDNISPSGGGLNSKLIVPSPTSADYLRNKTRQEISGGNRVQMKPIKPSSTFINNDLLEMNQILYDDMAYRQLRKDTSNNSYTNSSSKKVQAQYRPPLMNFPSNLTNITTLPSNNNNNDSSISSSLSFSNTNNSLMNTKTIRALKQSKAFKSNLGNYNNNNSMYSLNRYNSENLDR
jgi:hypothetical protein